MKPSFVHLTTMFFMFLTSLLFQPALTTRPAHSTIRLVRTADNGLQLRRGAPFKMVLFADLHFGESAWTSWGPKQDLNSVKAMSSVLDHEIPDFVVYLGEVITANNIPVANASLYWGQAIAPTKSRDIPWASVFGNHDDAPFEWPMEWFSAPGIPRVRLSCATQFFRCRQYL